MTLSTSVRRLMPLALRQEIKHHGRKIHDMASGVHFDSGVGRLSPQHSLCIVQPIMQSNFYDNKVINITRGAMLLNQSLIRPSQSWSFWHRTRRPDTSNGFVAGRNLVNGKLIAQTAGGLCQLSSMAYHLALLSGLIISERHPHSIDIYEEHQRYTPLGADATVVWGFKDLRLYNPYPFSVSFEFGVKASELIGRLNAEHELTALQVEFVRIPTQKPFVKVNTVINGKILATSIYQQQQGLQAVSA